MESNPNSDRQQHTSRNGDTLQPTEQKVDQLLHKQAKHPTPSGRSKDQKQFYTRIKNLTNIKLNPEEIQLLNYGLNYSIEKPVATYITNLAADSEQAIRLLDEKLQNTYRFMAAKKLKQIKNSASQTNTLQKRQLHIIKELKKTTRTTNNDRTGR
jgi:uncharacterized protein (DUF885 family)